MTESSRLSRRDEDLKPCPFCGGSATVLREGNRRHSAQVSCDECGVVWEGPNTAGWNLREIASEKEESERPECVKARAAVSAGESSTPRTVARHNGLEADPEGVFVYYDDYLQLERELAEAQQRIVALESMNDNLASANIAALATQSPRAETLRNEPRLGHR